ncbi:flagellar basal body-associated FliL family protein [Stakelama tenebrarum]|uniref:Flagellar protein FliL n=1 Tax=Stakelama tenebrarum TaxID=2711215 RepID=A0A6G6Y403_9SPHN|nr:flagellar basal body-associated FliL family protein [Sphingosinithalassobacter tenebrarum]QIG79674.1 flagellar basal body protein FliL [Sphingosinithalassobacter tenebrarum]
MSDEIVEVTEATPAPKKSKKKLIILGAAAGVVLLGGGGGAAMMLGGGGEETHEEAAAAEEGGHDAPAETAAEGGHGEAGGEGAAEPYIDVPMMLVNLRSPDGGARFLKIHFMLVPGPNGAGLEEKLPVLLDSYQPFLRELRPVDLAGSAAVYRIKEEMLVRANQALGSGVVSDVLIQDLVQQ